MDETAARTRLASMTAWETAPVLTDDEQDALLEMAKRADRYGRAPDATGWEATWDLNAAAAEGWGWKAAKVAHRFDFSLDQQSMKVSQPYDHCIARQAYYRARITGTLPQTPRLTGGADYRALGIVP
jgi:hypothetical protein